MLNAGRILKSISPSSYEFSESVTTDPADIGSVAAFLSWLSYSCDTQDLMTAELLSQFFQECMEYPHWQQKKKSLGEEVRHFLEAICLHQDEVFDFSDVMWPGQMQIIELEHLPDWVDVVSSYLTSQHHSQEKFRLIHDEGAQRLIAVVLKTNGEISIRQFSRKFSVRNGALAPLREDLELHYNSRLEFKNEVAQKIETAPFTTARFLAQDGQLFGTVARGYFFQKLNSFSGIDLSSSPKLFYTIRRLEQHFIKRESDPFYQAIVDGTEHCIRMLKIGDDEFLQKAPDVLSQAQNALEHVFIGDKLLSLLVRDLQYTMAGSPVVNLPKTTAVKQKEEDTWLTTPITIARQNQRTVNPAKNLAKAQPRQWTQAPLAPHPREPDLTN